MQIYSKITSKEKLNQNIPRKTSTKIIMISKVKIKWNQTKLVKNTIT